MTRFSSQALRRRALQQALFDLGLLLCAVAGVVLIHAKDAGLALPAAAPRGLSLVAVLLIINTVSGFYRPSASSAVGKSCVRAAFALLLAMPLAWSLFDVLPGGIAQPDSVKWMATFMVGAIIGHRAHAAHANKPAKPNSRILIFGSGPTAQLVGSTLRAANPRARIVGYFRGPNEPQGEIVAGELVGNRQSLRTCAIDLRVDEIIIALTERRGGSMPLRDLLDCKIAGMRVSDLSTYFERVLGQIRIDHVRAGWLIFGNGFHQGWQRTLVKRAVDLTGSLVLLLLALPLLLITAVAIKLESRGAVFYQQERVGLDGRTFKVVKFRSMRTDAEKDGQPRWAATKDDRITRVGAVIRRYRIDEFPQLLNVLQGDMSLVGPRPERPFFVAQLQDGIPFYAVRHSVKPGVTGWAQVRFQYGATVADSLEKLQYDLYYVKNHTLMLDLLILFETIRVVLSGDGAR